MKTILILLMALAAIQPAFAQLLANGQVKRVNEQRKEITIAHGPIPHLAMDSMTMAFPVKDPAMLKQVKPGDKVNFRAEMINKEAVITKIEVAK